LGKARSNKCQSGKESDQKVLHGRLFVIQHFAAWSCFQQVSCIHLSKHHASNTVNIGYRSGKLEGKFFPWAYSGQNVIFQSHFASVSWGKGPGWHEL
jgi:hypothetical protein